MKKLKFIIVTVMICGMGLLSGCGTVKEEADVTIESWSEEVDNATENSNELNNTENDNAVAEKAED